MKLQLIFALVALCGFGFAQGSHQTAAKESPEDRAKLMEACRASNERAKLIDGLVASNRLAEACRLLEGDLALYPENYAIAERLADVYFLRKEPQQAFAVLQTFKNLDPSGRTIYLRKMLAAARTKRPWVCDRAYIVEGIIGPEHVPDSASWVRQGASQSALEALCCLALAMEERSNPPCRYYASEALRLDPGNPIACEMLGSIEGGKPNCHYALAAQIYSQGIPRASGTILDMLKFKRDVVQSLHDRFGG